MTVKRIYWIDEYSDETVPCDCSLEGWATWLSSSGLDYGRSDAASDGDSFAASSAIVSYHRRSMHLDAFTPFLPASFDFLAPCFGEGLGWDADEIVTTLKELDEVTALSGDQWVAVVQHDSRPLRLVYRADPPRLEVAPYQ